MPIVLFPPRFGGHISLLLVLSTNFFYVTKCDYSRFQGNFKGRQHILPEVPKIAIIGGGVGGTSTAYFLRELLGDSVKVDLYEKSHIIGGRLHTVEVFGRHYETGGSIIHPRNKYAVDLTEKLGLRKKEKEPGSEFGLLKDHQVVFSSSSWQIVTILKILYRYGLDFNYLHSFVTKLIDDFSQIYDIQSQQQISFEHPFELLSSMSPGIANLTRSSFKKFLQELNFKGIFIEELVQAITFVNYGQDTNIHALVGSIAVGGADDGLWSIENGNKNLPIALATSSKANIILNSLIHSITDNRNGTYGLSIKSVDKMTTDVKESEETIVNYDFVVIAHPMEVSKIKFIGFPSIPYDVNERKYHQTVATIVSGILQENFTMSTANVDSLFTCDAEYFFTTVGRIYPVDSKSKNSEVKEKYPVYKIFSPKPLTDEQLQIVFSKVYQVNVFDWFAYPHYSSPGLESLPSFLLDDWNLFYLNSIEWAASAIEMSLISAKNIALLVSQRLDESQNNNDNNRDYASSKNKPNLEDTRKIEL